MEGIKSDVHTVSIGDSKVLEITQEKDISVIITWDGKGKMMMDIFNAKGDK